MEAIDLQGPESGSRSAAFRNLVTSTFRVTPHKNTSTCE